MFRPFLLSTKNLGAYGDAGMIVTNSKSIYQKCKMLRKYGMKNFIIQNLKINSDLMKCRQVF